MAQQVLVVRRREEHVLQQLCRQVADVRHRQSSQTPASMDWRRPLEETLCRQPLCFSSGLAGDLSCVPQVMMVKLAENYLPP